MRRRSSGSGDDGEDGQGAIPDGASEKNVEDGGEMRANPPATQNRLNALGNKEKREMEVSPELEEKALFPLQAASSPRLEHNANANDGPPQSKEREHATAEYHRQRRARLRGPWSCSVLTLATTACSILVLFGIVQSFLNRQLDPKGCAMSYMMPQFTRFSDFDTEHTRFASKYSLYLYREGGVDDDTRVKGVPVLFIPGNAGSYKQVRPIAAEAAHYFQDVLREDPAALVSGKRPLDFFTVDFNEEFSAFHGQTLLDQAEYLNEAVSYILALYHNPNGSLREPGLPDPKSVIILGHSMGGMVGRTMLRMPNYQERTINTIITLAAPHARAPMSFDSNMVAVYNDINTFWRESYAGMSPAKNPLADVTMVSVAGGGLDTMIPSEYSSLTSLVPDTHGFTVFTSAIPNVWTGMDHLAIMWCDQFRKALAKAIYDIVDVRRSSQTLDQSQRIKAFRKRLLTGMESVVQKAELEQAQTTFLTLDHSSTSIMAYGQGLQLRSLGQTGAIRAHVMPIPAQPFVQGSKFTMLTDQTLNPGSDQGSITLLLCSVFPPTPGASGSAFTVNMDMSTSSAGSTRLACRNAASDVSYLPASTNESTNAFDSARPFSYVQYDLITLANYQFIAVIEKATELSPGWVFAEFSSATDSTLTISRGHHQLLLSGLHVKLPAGRSLMTELKIPEVHSTLFAYTLLVNRKACESAAESFAPLLRQYIQEPYESKYFVNTVGGNINVHGISPYMPPPLNGKEPSEGLSLQLWSDPTCNSTVEISLTVDVVGSAGKLVMRYRTVFAAFPLLIIAIVLRKQFKVYDTTGVFMSFAQSMDQCLRTSIPVIILALTFLSVALSKATQSAWTRHLFSRSADTDSNATDFTVNDLLLGTADPFFWFLVPLFGVISVGVCIVANYIVLLLTHILTFIYGRVRALAYSSDDLRRSSSYFTGTSLNQRVVITAILLLFVTTIVPYQFAYIVLCVVQLATCTRALRVARDADTGPAYDFYNYVHSLLVLMLWILPVHMLVLIVWVRNLAVHWLTPFSTHHNVLAVLPAILLVECLSTGSMIPRVTSRLRFVTNVSLFALALYAAVYGVTYAYRLYDLINGLCAWLVIIHLSTGPLSLANLGPLINRREEVDEAGRNVKKRP